ncbi:MAG: TIGR00730 family Rossman fold protein [Alphaproteobacteria bacterium]|nr:TIGR00730 family Rossman fold protein [Alphaproteobacteria bacterium]
MTRPLTLTVYLGSSGHARTVFQNTALQLGEIIGRNKSKLVYGGMDAGLMGLLAVNALRSGAHVTGIVPQKLKDSERILQGLSETILVGDLWERKKKMFDRADAIIALPGGFGTLDEALEILYWAKLGLHSKPVVLVNIENYWEHALAFLTPLQDFDPRFLIVVPDVQSVMPALEAWQPPPRQIQLQENYPHFEAEITRQTDEPIIIDKASVENAYYGVCALGLKQIGKHNRPIGFLNKDGQFDGLLKWFMRASEEKFITQKCLQLYSAAADEESLRSMLKDQAPVVIDLHKEKWGAPRKQETIN